MDSVKTKCCMGLKYVDKTLKFSIKKPVSIGFCQSAKARVGKFGLDDTTYVMLVAINREQSVQSTKVSKYPVISHGQTLT
jgi:hypothetical protein